MSGFTRSTTRNSIFSVNGTKVNARVAGLAAATTAMLLIAANAIGQTIPGLPFTEDFDFDNLEDDLATTADWNTGLGLVQLPSENALTTPFSTATLPNILAGAFITRALATGDMDGDGDLDLVEGVSGGSGVYLNDGAGGFGLGRIYTSPAGANTRGLAVADMDGDGDLDWVAGNFSNAPPRAYLNDGDGISYTIQDFGPTNYMTYDVVIADVNSDGHLDVILANGGSEQNRIYYNTGDPQLLFGPGGFSNSALGSLGEDSREVAAGDLDADGDLDLVVLNEGQLNRVHMNEGIAGNGAAIFSAGEPIGTDTQNSRSGALGDLNGDGFADLVVANWEQGDTSKVYLNNAMGPGNDPFLNVTPIEITIANDPDFAIDVKLGDADNDGDLDIFLMSEGHFFGTRLLLNDGTGMVYVRADIGMETEVTREGVLGDFDADGDIDLITGNQIFQNSTSSPEVNRLYRNSGTDAGGPAVLQLSASAVSLEVDNTIANIDSVRLTTAETSAGPASLNDIDYWVSNNAGSNWVHARPGRPVGFATMGSILIWRAEFDSRSPANAAALSLDTLTLELNSAPFVVTPIGPQSATEGQAFSVFPDIDDGDTPPDPLFYSISGLPIGTGLSIDPQTGEVSGIPTNADAEESFNSSGISLTVTASDRALSVDDSFVLTVADQNSPPTFTSVPVTSVANGVAYSYAITTQDEDPGDVLTIISVNPLPTWLTLVDNGDGTATLSGTPTGADVGDHVIDLEVSDVALATDTQSFTITVTNNPPAFTSTPLTNATNGSLYSYSVTASDPDVGDVLTITSVNPLPAWLILVDNGDGTATLSGTPSGIDVGDHVIDLEVADAALATDTQSFTITVTNNPPAFTSVPVTNATNGSLYSYSVTASDPDAGDVLTITAVNPLPVWLSLVDNGDGTATLSGTPTGLDAGDHAIDLQVSDVALATDTQSFTITVTNNPPAFTSAPVLDATQDLAYSYAVTATDPDVGDTLLITASLLPAWLSIVDNGGGMATLSGTPSNADVGMHNVALDVSDMSGASDTQNFTITVANVNDLPSFSSTPVTDGMEDVLYQYNVTASDPDFGDTLAIAATTLPAWLTLNDNGDGTALLSGTPTESENGDHAVELEVSDAANATATQSFTVAISAVNDSPIFTSSSVTSATEGQAYSYNISASDPDDASDTLVISAPVMPAWLSIIDNGDGTATLTGTPLNSEVGSHSIELRVEDPAGAADTQAFTVTVSDVNFAPVFTSMPLTNVTEAQAYQYLITTTDADGDPITFTGTLVPAWLTLTDNGNGTAELSGMPTGAEVGTHAVELMAQDTLGMAGMQQFSIDVVAAAEGPVITLNGDQRMLITQRGTFTDPGASATDPQDGDLTAQIVVDNPVDIFTVGTYTMTYTVSDSAGNVSQAQRTVVVQRIPDNGGGGSIGLADLLAFALLAFSVGATRRRRIGDRPAQ